MRLFSQLDGGPKKEKSEMASTKANHGYILIPWRVQIDPSMAMTWLPPWLVKLYNKLALAHPLTKVTC